MKFLLLLRPVNLLIIALTMYITKIFLVEAILTGSFLIELQDIYQVPAQQELNFLLLVIMVILVAAGGNIINDYFDVRADRINKPEKTYIDYHISRGLALKSHIVFNVLAIGIAIYLWIATNSIAPLLFALGGSILLLLYSMVLKRKLFIGNFTVAVLTGIVPLIAYTFMIPILNQYENTSLDFTLGTITFKLIPYYDTIAIVGIFCFFAFIMNYIREIVKDIIDIPGDQKVGCKTFPISFGILTTKIIIGLLLFICISIFLFPFVMWPGTLSVPIILYPFLLILILLGIATLLVCFASQKKHYKITSFILKIIMLIGILLPVILNYGTNDF